MSRILIADDHENLRKALAWLCNLVATKRYRPQPAEKPLKRVIAAQPSLILLDLRLPDMNGADAARAIKKDQRAYSDCWLERVFWFDAPVQLETAL